MPRITHSTGVVICSPLWEQEAESKTHEYATPPSVRLTWISGRRNSTRLSGHVPSNTRSAEVGSITSIRCRPTSPYVTCQPAARDPAEQDWITAVEANDLPALRALSVSC
jgi:hypothetical protein